MNEIKGIISSEVNIDSAVYFPEFVSGHDGFSPEVTEAVNNDVEYVLEVTNADGSYFTPNLRGKNGQDGTNGKDGKAGINGQDGKDGTNGADGFSPEVTVTESTDTEYVLTITDADGSYNTPNLKGAQGIQGEQGIQGIQGAKGDTGSTNILFRNWGES